ncbi:MAG: hypothetical protein IPJ77_04755 [Planctomycetes bacterium]|nr:hypothetical protein [Planctomycetota bacterium]
MRSSIARTALLGLLLLGSAGCGGSSQPPRGGALGPTVQAPLRFAGRLSLSGSLAGAREGGVLVRLVEQATGRVVLRRIYDLGDPLWDRRAAEQSLYFALTPDSAFDAEPPVHAPIVLEAVHLPAGVAAEPSAADERVVVLAEPGVLDVELRLHGAAEVAGAHAPSPR